MQRVGNLIRFIRVVPIITKKDGRFDSQILHQCTALQSQGRAQRAHQQSYRSVIGPGYLDRRSQVVRAFSQTDVIAVALVIVSVCGTAILWTVLVQVTGPATAFAVLAGLYTCAAGVIAVRGHLLQRRFRHKHGKYRNTRD